MKLNILATTLTLVASAVAVEWDADSKESICAAAKLVADGEWNYYEGLKRGGTVGMFTNPYYWWHAGEAFGGLLDYYIYCDKDNSTLKSLIFNGMYHQAGDDYNYIPSNQSMTEGNDDQGVWGLALLEAVERNFTDPEHSWLSMAQAVYNTMYLRWDTSHCGGGLRWQIFTWNSGYDYKNSISNGCLFHIAARLGRYLQNDTYVEVAEKVWDWVELVGFATYEDGDDLVIWDGADIDVNCTDLSKNRWSYNYGVYMAGCAYLYNYTQDEKWLTRASEIVHASTWFFNNSIMYERTCAVGDRCNNDQRSFRSLFSRFLGLTSVMAPSTSDTIRPLLEASAAAAAQSCSGGYDGVTCGENWSVNGWDGKNGLGEQMSALEVMLAVMVNRHDVPAPYDSENGGSSTSNVNAGIGSVDQTNQNLITVTQKDKAGAGALTAIVLAILLGGAIWMLF